MRIIAHTVCELLNKATRWTKYTFAKTRDGVRVTPSRLIEEADCFCLEGALMYVLNRNISVCRRSEQFGKLKKAILELFPERARTPENLPNCAVFAFNDHPDTTFEDVRKVVELAGV